VISPVDFAPRTQTYATELKEYGIPIAVQQLTTADIVKSAAGICQLFKGQRFFEKNSENTFSPNMVELKN
jgi:hypothetical protein